MTYIFSKDETISLQSTRGQYCYSLYVADKSRTSFLFGRENIAHLPRRSLLRNARGNLSFLEAESESQLGGRRGIVLLCAPRARSSLSSYRPHDIIYGGLAAAGLIWLCLWPLNVIRAINMYDPCWRKMLLAATGLPLQHHLGVSSR